MGNWNFEFLFGNLILMTANVAVVVEGIYWIWSLPTFVSSSFLCNLVCQKAGIRNNTYICLKKSWSSPNWDEIGKYKSNKKLWYFISIFTQLHRLQNPCSVHPKTPHILSCTLTLRLGEPEKKQLVGAFWSHMWPSFSVKLGRALCVFVSFGSDWEFVSYQYCHVLLILIKCSACCHTSKLSILVSVNMKLRLCSGFMDRSHS